MSGDPTVEKSSDPKVVKYAYEAIKEDAKEWEKTGQVLEMARRRVETLTLTANDFQYLGNLAGAVAAYKSVQETIVRLLGEGVQTMDGVSDILHKVVGNRKRAEDDAENAVRDVMEGT